ncbi:hypothetical protein Plhal304r1_c003g0010641 [Plasmopara halstedii]
MMTLTGSNTTPVQCQIQVYNGNPSKRVMDREYQSTISESGSISRLLHLRCTSLTGAGGTTVNRLRTDNGAAEFAPDPITYSVAGIFVGYIACPVVAMMSDCKLKRNNQSCPLERIKRLHDYCDVVL